MLTHEEVRELLKAITGRYLQGEMSVPELWKILCAHGVHDYEFVVINQKGALLRCFYCEHEKISTKSWMKPRGG